ncbi:hypothetical protein GY45DRAFT_559505 [Cubamyces sp. BRFM 1775]|nr:hypothetical protein GY45DRAFT_559505 [Cubamyces sp. BRFM 1775]
MRLSACPRSARDRIKVPVWPGGPLSLESQDSSNRQQCHRLCLDKPCYSPTHVISSEGNLAEAAKTGPIRRAQGRHRATGRLLNKAPCRPATRNAISIPVGAAYVHHIRSKTEGRCLSAAACLPDQDAITRDRLPNLILVCNHVWNPVSKHRCVRPSQHTTESLRVHGCLFDDVTELVDVVDELGSYMCIPLASVADPSLNIEASHTLVYILRLNRSASTAIGTPKSNFTWTTLCIVNHPEVAGPIDTNLPEGDAAGQHCHLQASTRATMPR